MDNSSKEGSFCVDMGNRCCTRKGKDSCAKKKDHDNGELQLEVDSYTHMLFSTCTVNGSFQMQCTSSTLTCSELHVPT